MDVLLHKENAGKNIIVHYVKSEVLTVKFKNKISVEVFNVKSRNKDFIINNIINSIDKSEDIIFKNADSLASDESKGLDSSMSFSINEGLNKSILKQSLKKDILKIKHYYDEIIINNEAATRANNAEEVVDISNKNIDILIELRRLRKSIDSRIDEI